MLGFMKETPGICSYVSLHNRCFFEWREKFKSESALLLTANHVIMN